MNRATDQIDVVSEPTVAFIRYEYAHLLFNVVDLYNTFLSLMIFKLDPKKTNILFVDAHPYATLDSVWNAIFGSVTRAGALKRPTLFKHMIWNMQRYSSPMHFKHGLPAPYLEEFRHFILSSFGISDLNRRPDCSNLTVLFNWRRNYVAHPRNPSGGVSRKVKNEQELIDAVKKALPGHTVLGMQADLLSFQEQLKLIAQTDVLGK